MLRELRELRELKELRELRDIDGEGIAAIDEDAGIALAGRLSALIMSAACIDCVNIPFDHESAPLTFSATA